MKRCLSLILVCFLLSSIVAYAEVPDVSNLTLDELTSLKQSVDDRIAELSSGITTPTATPAPTPEPSPSPSLKIGSKGDAVKMVQDALIKLGYLEGTADGLYGKGTAAAVSAFQQQNGLNDTGTADADTQALLLGSNPKPAPTPDPNVFKKGATYTFGTTEFTVVSMGFKNKLMPDDRSGYYWYLNPSKGNVFYDVVVKIKNIGKSTITELTDLPIVSCVYDTDYIYSASMCVSNGSSMENLYAYQLYISPLSEYTIHYALDVPKEVKTSKKPFKVIITGLNGMSGSTDNYFQLSCVIR